MEEWQWRRQKGRKVLWATCIWFRWNNDTWPYVVIRKLSKVHNIVECLQIIGHITGIKILETQPYKNYIFGILLFSFCEFSWNNIYNKIYRKLKNHVQCINSLIRSLKGYICGRCTRKTYFYFYFLFHCTLHRSTAEYIIKLPNLVFTQNGCKNEIKGNKLYMLSYAYLPLWKHSWLDVHTTCHTV